MDMVLLNIACPGLLGEPLYTTIGQLLTPYCHGGCQGNNQQTYNEIYTHSLLAILMAITMRRYHTAHIADGEGPGLS